MMVTHECESVAELWVSLTRRCIEDGTRSHDGDVKLLELTNVPFHVSGPLTNHDAAEAFYDTEMVAAMHRNFHSLEPQFGYKVSYGERIWTPEGSSQYEAVREVLRRKPEAKSATMSLLRLNDSELGHVPCITTIDFKIRDGQLNVAYFARSQDVFKKSFADNLAISQIGERLAADLGVRPGSIGGYIVSAHIYETDLPRISAIEPFAHAVAQRS